MALLLDEDPSHTAGDSQELAAALGIRLIWLPKRCPELNGMDHLWGHGKDHLCANKQYESIDQEARRQLHGETPSFAFRSNWGEPSEHPWQQMAAHGRNTADRTALQTARMARRQDAKQ